VFSLIRGYKYLLQVLDGSFHSFYHHHASSCGYAKEVFREVGRIMDPIGLNDINFPRDFVFWIATNLLVVEPDYLHDFEVFISSRVYTP
jgi:hypothetical protein